MDSLDRDAGGISPKLREGFCRCDGPMPTPSDEGTFCFGCDKLMDEDSYRGLYEAPVDEWPFDDDPPDPL